MSTRAAHGGEFFHAVGDDFQHLDRLREVISADVLDAWFDPSPQALKKVCEYLPDLLRTSPPLDAEGLVATIARVRGIPAECVLTGAGSSDLIFTCLPQLVSPGSRVMLTDPVYGEYPYVFGELIGADLVRHMLLPEDDFRMNVDELMEDVRKHQPGLIALVNPNSPTGRLWPRQQAIEFLNAVPHDTKVLIDETYIDYAGSENSLEREVPERPGLMILKSMSKTYALSGLRAGYLVAAPSIVGRLRRFMPPWAISLLGQVAAVEALNDSEYYLARYEETRVLREGLADDLEGIPGLRVYHSDVNFLLVECVDHPIRVVLERCREKGVYLRDCSTISTELGHFFRVSVKQRDQNRVIGATIRHALGVA